MIASIPGQTIGVNVFSERLIVDLGLSRTNVSLAYMIGTTVSGISLPWVGVLYDQLGARKIIVVASVGLGLSLFYMSTSDIIADNFAALLNLDASNFCRLVSLTIGFFLIRFFGQGMLTLSARNIVGKWWVNHRGKILSISGIAVSICFSLTPKFFDYLIESFGWRHAWQAIGLASLFGVAFIGWFAFRDNPQECGLQPDGGRTKQSNQEGNPEFSIIKEFTRKEAIGSYAFWIFSLTFSIQGLYSTGYAFHVIDLADSIGMTKAAILNLFVPVALLGAAISIFVGWASDRWRLKRLIMLMAVGIGITPLGLILQLEKLTPVFITVGFGIASGCFGTLSGAFMPRFFGLKNLGAISGFFMSQLVISSAVGPWLFSINRDFSGNYNIVHWVTCVVAGFLAIGALWADNPQRKLAAQPS